MARARSALTLRNVTPVDLEHSETATLFGFSNPLLRALCHDLRAPLASITMGTEFSLQQARNMPNAARLVTMLEAVARSCAHIDALITEFHDAAQAAEHALTLAPQEHKAIDIMNAALASAATAYGTSTPKVSFEFAAPATAESTVYADKRRILQAMRHALTEATRNMREDCTLLVSLHEHQAENKVHITIKFPKAALGAVEQSTITHSLPLAIAASLTAAQGGSLQLCNDAEVASLTFCLPALAPKQQA